jgi:hypothetical protein
MRDHSYPALAFGGITVYPSTLIIVRFPPQLPFDGSSGRFLQWFFEIAKTKGAGSKQPMFDPGGLFLLAPQIPDLEFLIRRLDQG